MRNGKNKIIKILFLVACVVLSTFAITAFAGTMKSATNNEYVAKSQLYTGSQAKAYINATENADRIPTLTDDNAADYLFAGWYVEDTFDTPIKAAAEITSDSANVYAKFVPKAVLGVKAQIKTNLYDNVVETKDETTEFRFITSIDSPNYKEVGIEVTYTNSKGEEVTKTNSDKTKVYGKLYVVGTNAGEYTNEEDKPVVPSDVFCNMSSYFKGYTLTGVPGAKYGTQFSAKAYWTTLDGTKVYGDSQTKCIEDGCIRNEVWVADTAATNKADGILGTQDRCYYGSQAYPYTSLDYALKMSNKSNNNVVIHMESDNSLTKTIYVQNTNGKDITIDGGNYTLTTVASQNAVCVYQTAGTATFQNMNIKHADGNMIFRIGESEAAYTSSNTLGFNLKNVEIDADTSYQWALISFLGYQTYNANLDTVVIDWDTTTAADSYGGVIRNAGNASSRTLNLTMTDCTVDASGAIARKGLELAQTTDKGTVKLVGTTSIKTENAYPIYTHGLTVERAATTTLESTNAFYDAQPVQDILNGIAKVNGQGYKTFSEAFVAAHDAGGTQTITLLQDCALGFNAAGEADNVTTSKEGFKLTIEGNGKKITTAQTGSKIALNANKAGVTIKNADVIHNSTDRLIQATDKFTETNITLDDVDVVANITGATETTYQYGVIHYRGSGAFTMKDSTMVVSTGDTALKEEAAIRVGGGSDNNTVTITVTGSAINTTGAKNMADIIVRKTTTADITVTGSTLNTQNVAPIRIDGYARTMEYDNATTWSCRDDESKHIYELLSNGTVTVATIGDAKYQTLEAAITAANASTTDATITLCKDVTLSDSVVIKNASGKNITLDGANYKVTTAAGKDTFKVQQTTGTVNFKNMNIVHAGNQLFRVAEASADYNSENTLALNFSNITIDADTTYEWAIIQFNGYQKYDVDMNKVTLDWDSTTGSTNRVGAIRTGNHNDAYTRTVNLTMTDCTVDVTGASGRNALTFAMNCDKGSIDLVNTQLKTKDTYVVYMHGIALTYDANTTMTSQNAYYDGAPIYDNLNGIAKIGGQGYMTFKDALVAANTAGGDVTITLLHDNVLGFNQTGGDDNYNLEKTGLNLTIDGNGRTITTGGTSTKLTLNRSDISLTVKDVDIVHNATDRLFQASTGYTGDDLTMTNVDIVANGGTADTAYQYGIIAWRGTGTVALNNVTVDMDINHASPASIQSGVIRTGNPGEAGTVTIDLTGCTFDTTGAANRPSIYVTSGTTADITLATSTLKTNNCEPIQIDGTAYLTKDSATTWSCNDSGITSITRGTVKEKAATMNGTPYATLNEALAAANTAGGTAKVVLYKNADLTNRSLSTAGLNLTIDGNDHTLTTPAGEGTVLALDNNNMALTIKNATIEHNHTDRLLQVSASKTGCGITLDNVDVNVNAVSTTNEWLVSVVNFRSTATFTMKDSNITMTNAASNTFDTGAIRIGNGGDGITVTINMTNSNIDVSKVTKVSAIRINNGEKASIKTNGVQLHTNNVAPIFVNSTATLDPLEMVDTTWTRGGDSTVNVYNTTTGTVNEIFTNRIVLMSDVHYLPSITKAEYDAQYPGANAPGMSGNIFGYTMSEKMNIIKSDVSSLQATKAVDSILVLGDLSTDDPGYRSLQENYVQKFKTDVMDEFGVTAYALPGNHDGYSNSIWNSIFGKDRQFSIEINGAAFIMLDTYDAGTVEGESGDSYKGIDTTWLKTEVAKYSGKPIFLCVHYMDEDTEDTALKQILTDNPNIVCIFRGHTHYSGVYTCKNLNNIKMINVSGYAYQGDEKCREFAEYSAWGYGVLEWTDNNAYYYHVKNARSYESVNSTTGETETINYSGAIEDKTRLVFNLNK